MCNVCHDTRVNVWRIESMQDTTIATMHEPCPVCCKTTLEQENERLRGMVETQRRILNFLATDGATH